MKYIFESVKHLLNALASDCDKLSKEMNQLTEKKKEVCHQVVK